MSQQYSQTEADQNGQPAEQTMPVQQSAVEGRSDSERGCGGAISGAA